MSDPNSLFGSLTNDIKRPTISPKLLELDCVSLLPHIGGLSVGSTEV